MLRADLDDRLKRAMKDKDARAVSTVRLILAAVKDRDIAARAKGNAEGIGEADILQVLQTMVRQREEAIGLYRKGRREELAKKEEEEIEVIRGFLPRQLEDGELAEAVRAVAGELGAASLKDMGRTMSVLKERYAGRMDFAKASAALRAALAGDR